jgi:hypothetical protein
MLRRLYDACSLRGSCEAPSVTVQTFREVVHRLVEPLIDELSTEDLAACRRALLEAAELVQARSLPSEDTLPPSEDRQVQADAEPATPTPVHALRAVAEALVLVLGRELDRQDQGEAACRWRDRRAADRTQHASGRGMLGP